ncbi:hypothetical protein E4U23_007218, partial [Claviceps purpurea]
MSKSEEAWTGKSFEKVVKVVDESVLTVDEESGLEAGREMKSDTEAELDGASAVDVKADVKPAEDTGWNLSFKLVWYAVLDERELELAGGGKDVAGMLSCVLGEFELIAAAVLEAEFAVDAEAAVEASGVLLTRDRNLSFKLVG